jgi:hypothetical protein
MDWGFVGDAYAAANPDQDAQELINWFLEQSASEHAKEKWTLLGCPGLAQQASTTVAEVRGAWVLPGGTQCLWVSGNGVYLMTATSTPSATSFPSVTMTLVGTIASTSGQVCIRDNATGGIAVIVDGTSAGYVYNIAAKTLKAISDPGFYGADKVAFIDGWLVFNKPGTQIFYSSPVYWNGTSAFDATYFALKDSSTDNLVTMVESLRELWLIGERTTEIWYDAGNQFFPFSRLQGISLQVGTSAKHSITRFGQGLAWLASSERGQNLVVSTEGYQMKVISSPAVSNAINTYPVVSDAIGYSYSEGGHTFYVLTFPTADVTWVYDAATEKWHKRMSFDAATGLMHRHRSNCYVNFLNQRFVGDYANGLIYTFSRTTYTDNGAPLVALRRTAHVWDGDQRERLFHSKLQVQFRSGQGPWTGQGSNPQMMLRWSDDSGQKWSNQRQIAIGKAGATRHRAMAWRLGAARDRIYEVSVSDPVCRDVIGASLEVSQ